MTKPLFEASREIEMPDSGNKTDSSWLRTELVASWKEIAAVLFLTLGYYAYCAALIGIHKYSGHHVNLLPTNYRLLHLMAGQSAILALFCAYLFWRGWKPSDFKIKIGWWGSLQGVLLLFVWLVLFFCFTCVLIMLRLHHSSLGLYTSSVLPSHPHRVVLSWSVMFLSEIINAYSEELTVMGYAFNQFAGKRGPLFALVLTTSLRLLYHTWKEPLFLVDSGISFLIFGIFYWRTRNLWALILAHASYDILLETHFLLPNSSTLMTLP